MLATKAAIDSSNQDVGPKPRVTFMASPMTPKTANTAPRSQQT